MRTSWRTVGGVCERVAAEAQRQVDLLAGLRRIGIDEISHRVGQRYLTVVVDHDSGRLVWAAAGRDRNYADFGVMPTWFRKPFLRAGICLVRSA